VNSVKSACEIDSHIPIFYFTAIATFPELPVFALHLKGMARGRGVECAPAPSVL